MNLLLLVLFVLDRFTKWYFTGTLNTGAAFSFFVGHNSVLTVITFLAVVGVGYWYYRERSFVLGLLLIGAFSNLLDRILFGGVVDFIALGFWPSFNLADAYLVVGVAWMMYLELRR